MTGSAQYAFGKNWQRFLRTAYSADAQNSSTISLCRLLGEKSMTGKTFLDIGCGSGIHSLAALRLGAERVISFDCDPDAVACAEMLRNRENSKTSERWHIMHGSVLDAAFMNSLPKADIVYSWGVLHHTGNLHQAIRNAAVPISADGIFCIALYSRTIYENLQCFGHPGPEEWLAVKQRYMNAGSLGKIAISLWYIWKIHVTPNAVRGSLACARELLRFLRMFYDKRGIDLMTRMRDWLGGWFMEYIREHECAALCCKDLHLDFVHMITGEGNTEFIFQKPNARTQWTAMLERRQWVTLQPPFTPNNSPGIWEAPLPQWAALSDSHEAPTGSPLLLWEDGVPLSWPHCFYEAMRRFGAGRYRHWGSSLYFTSSDGTDPNANGRVYTCSLDIPDTPPGEHPCAE
ncbi:MAG: class I SAM-dependent methyltransferase [Deltaproteobacteria bacterium]|jgi:SAM-dependent methyltransferase|nr:class I SAM-dependent methyltransferase [Deltaproteobacteria bacterium]